MTKSKNTNTTLRCATYIRVSVASKGQEAAIQNQLSFIQQYCFDHGLEITETYIDMASGITPKRNSLQRMIADMSKNKFDIILSKEISRLSRSNVLFCSLSDAAQKYDIKMLTLDGAINTLENDSNLLALYTYLSF